MAKLRRPQAGQPISARSIGSLMDVAEAAARFTADGADLSVTASGRNLVLRGRDNLRMVELAGAWTHNPSQNDTATMPGNWHYCQAKLLQRYPGSAVGWASRKPEQIIYVWAPTLYSAEARDTERAEDQPPFAEDFIQGDWCWAKYDHDSGLWLLVEGGGGASVGPATIIRAQVDAIGGVDYLDSTFAIKQVSILAPIGATEYPGGSAPASVLNFLKFPAEDGARVIAFYDPAGQEWLGIPAIYAGPCDDPCPEASV